MKQFSISKFAVMLMAAAALLMISCKSKPPVPSDTRHVLGTDVTITIYDEGQTVDDLQRVFDQAFATMEHWEAMTLIPGDQNQVYKISEGAGSQSVIVDPAVYEMLMKALRFFDLSGELFDIRYGPMLDAWGFDATPHVPTTAEIDTALVLVRDGGMFVAGKSILLARKGMRFDAREFVQGYVFDVITAELAEKGFRTVTIHSPYVWRLMGDPPDPRGFEVTFSHPANADSVWARIFAPVGGICYLNTAIGAFSEGGKSYHRLLNPYTGMPAMERAGVIVQGKDAASASAMAYALFVQRESDEISEKGRAEIGGSVTISSELTTETSGSLSESFEIVN